VLAAFVDFELLAGIDPNRVHAPIVAVLDQRPANVVAATVNALRQYPWLSHVVTARMLAAPQARAQLAQLLDRVAFGVPRTLLGPSGRGRVALLAQASHREPRRERIQEFFAKHGLSQRALASIGEVCEELVMNALYDAPLEAGYFTKAVPRTEDVALPSERACEISYGIDQGDAFVRVRDTFGALSRQRLVEVLHRCNSRSVGFDESRGGAGLGLWRVLTSASSIAITVVPGTMTDIVVGLRTHQGKLGKELVSTNLFFAPPAESEFDSLIPDDGGDYLDQSITLVGVAV
jgi:hypothetical protein